MTGRKDDLVFCMLRACVHTHVLLLFTIDGLSYENNNKKELKHSNKSVKHGLYFLTV